MKCLYSLLLCLVALGQSLVPAADPSSLRVAVVDESGSMSGPRAKVVREELAKIARQLPPSSQHPIALILFGNKAIPAKVFTDLAPLEAAVNRLDGNEGGTCIAAGLEEAARYLAQTPRQGPLVLMLYTDGEDSDTAAIERAEQKLGTLLSTQAQQQGLPASVFLKRWGGANDQLAKRLRAHPGLQVVDAQEVAITPVRITPQIEFKKLTPSPDGRWLDVTARSNFTIQGATAGDPLPRIKLTSASPGVKLEPVEVDPRQANQDITLRISTTDASPLASIKSLLLRLIPVSSPAGSSRGLVLPQLTASEITLPVSLPEPELRHRIVAALDFHQPPRWTDPRLRRAVYPLKITFDVTGDAAHQGQEPASFALRPTGATRIITGPTSFTIPGPGKFDVLLELEAVPVDPATELSKLRMGIGFAITPIRLPPNVRFEPPQLNIERHDLLPPDALTTRLLVRVEQAAPAQWAALPNLAAFDLILRIESHGVLPASSPLEIVPDDPGQRLVFAPARLEAATQRVRVRILVPTRPAPSQSSLRLQVRARNSNQRLPIQFESPAPLPLTMVGPAPLSLVHAPLGTPITDLAVTLWDNERSAAVALLPRLTGSLAADQRSLPLIQIQATGQTLAVGRINEPIRLLLAAPANANRPFFRDVQEVRSLQLVPQSACPAVAPGQLRVTVTHLAPFRRLLLWLSIGGAASLSLAVIVRTVSRLKHQGA